MIIWFEQPLGNGDGGNMQKVSGAAYWKYFINLAFLIDQGR